MKQRRPALALGLSTLAMASSFMVWNVFSPIAGSLREAFGLTALQQSVLVAAPVLLGSVMRFPMGIFTDRFGGRRVFTSLLLFLVLPLLLTPFVSSYATLLLSAFLLGMAGTAFSVSMTYVSKWYPPQKQGLVLGLAGLGNLGVAMSSFLVPLVYRQYGLPGVFYGLAGLILVTAALFRWGAGELPLPEKKQTVQESLKVLRFRSTWLLSLFYFLTFGGFVAFSVYLPTLLKELFGMAAADAGLATAGFVAAATFIRPLGGYLADRIGSRQVLLGVFIGIAGAALLLAFSLKDFRIFAAGCLLAGLCFGLGNGAVFKMVPEIAPGHTGAVTGVVGAAGGVGGFFPPIVLGLLRDSGGTYMPGFVLLALFACICLWLNGAGRRMKEREPAKVSAA
ncbi:MFS transporter [Paenibacillus mucilaginosus]|uniref:Nitrate/nitrite extrusion protein n=3 Tax=Paenibacillus mucilaginosus TaxID=61624 RepID=H6N8V9_9BACL|nr:MFS transporter [Paenibacillus mucilaginosus]AFC27705.1 nitrate/nitrite extrusion protein [Paenibacillus mucilaginosus 3016]MCG7214726.1 MFS transporter [Paenibacillus mucilaginosus]WDM28414.1 NarK/NasA family nitrate transporter [Paenibacillus mucilaginosus]